MTVFSQAELELSPREVAERMAADPELRVIDVREEYEHRAGYIGGAQHIELERLAAQADTLDRERPVIFHCRIGVRSAMAAQAFRAAGYEAYSMRGGLIAWTQAGLPISPEGGRVADH